MDTAVSAAQGWVGLLPAPDTAPSTLNLAYHHRMDQKTRLPAPGPDVRWAVQVFDWEKGPESPG